VTMICSENLQNCWKEEFTQNSTWYVTEHY